MSAKPDNPSKQHKAGLNSFFIDEDPELTPERYWERRQRDSNQLTFSADLATKLASKQ